MKILEISNPAPLSFPYTLISSDYSSGTTLNVEDTTGFIDNDLILVGGIGDEKTEVTDLTATPPNDTQLTIAALKFDHAEDESIQKVPYDKFDIDYRTTPSGNWISLTTNQLFDWGREITNYVHEAGQDSYEYRVRYYNSATAQYSGYSGIAQGEGFDRNQVGYVLGRVKKKVRGIATDPEIDEIIIADFNDVHDIVKGMNRKWWFLRDTEDYVTESGVRRYALPDNFERLRYVMFNYKETTVTDQKYRLKYRTPVEFDALYTDQIPSETDDVVDFTIDLDTNEIVLGQSPETDDLPFTLFHYKSLEDVEAYDDVLPIPLPMLYFHYAASELWAMKNNQKKVDYHKQEFGNMLQVLLQMRSKTGGVKSIKKWMGYPSMKRAYGGSVTNEEDW